MRLERGERTDHGERRVGDAGRSLAEREGGAGEEEEEDVEYAGSGGESLGINGLHVASAGGHVECMLILLAAMHSLQDKQTHKHKSARTHTRPYSGSLARAPAGGGKAVRWGDASGDGDGKEGGGGGRGGIPSGGGRRPASAAVGREQRGRDSVGGDRFKEQEPVGVDWSCERRNRWPQPLERVRDVAAGQLRGLERRDCFGRSYLHWAALGGWSEASEILLQCGLSTISEDSAGDAPIHLACRAELRGDAVGSEGRGRADRGSGRGGDDGLECVRLIFAAAAREGGRGGGGGVEGSGLLPVEVVRRASLKGGHTPLHSACLAGSAACVALLMKSKATITPDHQQTTPLHLAMARTDGNGCDVIQTLLAGLEGSNDAVASVVNSADHKGMTPLHYAALQSSIHELRALLATPGIEVNGRDQRGRSALMLAVSRGDEPLVVALINARAQLQGFDDRGRTPIEEAIARKHGSILRHMLQSNSKLPGVVVQSTALASAVHRASGAKGNETLRRHFALDYRAAPGSCAWVPVTNFDEAVAHARKRNDKKSQYDCSM